MFSALELPPSWPVVSHNLAFALVSDVNPCRSLFSLRQPNRRLPMLSFRAQSPLSSSSSEHPVESHYTEAIVYSSPSLLQISQLTINQHHILILNAIACVTAISATWLFCSAIPTLLAFKKAAESLEKLMDVTREELPGTMAAIRLSGMEISDLTMELSDLGQGITQGVRSSTRAVRDAEEKLRRLTNMTQTASVQAIAVTNLEMEAAEPMVARTARGIKEGIVKGRSTFQLILTLTRFSRLALNYFSGRAKR